MSTSCGPTVQDYSDGLQGTWTAPLEDSEDGTIERGNVFITFAPIPEGSESSRVTVFYSGHLDATSTYGYSADCTVSVKGTYSIDDTDEKFPLDLRWDINSLDVNVSNVKISDVVQDFQASLEEIVASAYFGISGGSRSSIKKELTKQMKSYCRQQLIERNNDHGWYGL